MKTSSFASLFSAMALMACAGALQPPEAVEPSSFEAVDPSVLDSDNSQVVRVLAYRNPAPQGGECVDTAYSIQADPCLEGMKTFVSKAEHPSKGEFKLALLHV